MDGGGTPPPPPQCYDEMKKPNAYTVKGKSMPKIFLSHAVARKIFLGLLGESGCMLPQKILKR